MDKSLPAQLTRVPLRNFGTLRYDSKATLASLDPSGKSYTDTTFYCTQAFFNELLEYNTTLPTGTRIGKIWKRDCRTEEDKMRQRITGEAPSGYKLGEYYEIDDPNKVGIRWRDIVICRVVED